MIFVQFKLCFYKILHIQHRPIKLRVFRHLLDTLFTILDRLNLTTKARSARQIDEREDWTTSNDPNRDLLPVVPADFHLFFNLVQLFERLLGTLSDFSHRTVFHGYARMFISTMAQKSTQFPLVSGFVRLMAAALKICGRLHFFETPPEDLTAFISAQVTRVQRIQGELQIACLECIFAAPTNLLERFALQLGPIYRIAFKLGLSDLRIATISLRSLKRLAKSLRVNVNRNLSDESPLGQLLRSVLPTLDVYLQAPGVVAELGDLPADAMIQKRAGTIRRKKRMLRVDESCKDSELVIFQKSILLFLGELLFI